MNPLQQSTLEARATILDWYGDLHLDYSIPQLQAAAEGFRDLELNVQNIRENIDNTAPPHRKRLAVVFFIAGAPPEVLVEAVRWSDDRQELKEVFEAVIMKTRVGEKFSDREEFLNLPPGTIIGGSCMEPYKVVGRKGDQLYCEEVEHVTYKPRNNFYHWHAPPVFTLLKPAQEQPNYFSLAL